MKIKKIFINCATGLGNIILFLPAYRALKRKYPDAKYTIALDTRFYSEKFIRSQFGENCRFVKIPQRSKSKIKYILSYIKLRRYYFDFTLMAYNGNSVFTAFCLLLVGAKKTLFFKTKNKYINKYLSNPILDKTNQHYIEKNFAILGQLGIKFDVTAPWLNISSHKKYNPEEIDIKYNKNIIIGIHPGGNVKFNSARLWPKEYYRTLLKKIDSKYNAKFYIFGKGKFERNLINYIIMEQGFECVDIFNKNLNYVARIISNCDVVISNDSSIMNLSVGLGIPTLAIIGPTNPKRTGPYGENHVIAKLNLNCMPCFNSGYSELCPHHKCLNKLYPEIVLNKLESLIINENII